MTYYFYYRFKHSMIENATFDINEYIRKYSMTNGENKQLLSEDITRLGVKDKVKLKTFLTNDGWNLIKRGGKPYSWIKPLIDKSLDSANQSTTQSIIPLNTFNLSAYVSAYYEQLNISFETKNYDVYNTFEQATAIRTKTAIYQDLSLKIVEAFENEIDWEGEAEGEDECFRRPFISHLNPTMKTFVSSFIVSDRMKMTNSAYGINMMAHIAKKYNYKYIIVMNESNNHLMKTCQRNDIPPENVIILNSSDIDDIRLNIDTINDINKSIHDEVSNEPINNEDIDESTSWRLVPYIPPKPESSIISLRPYQLEYIQYMNEHERGIFRLPCGMGKSLIIIYHMLTHKQNSVILVPNVALVSQFHSYIMKYYKAFNEPLPEIHKLSTKDKEFEIKNPNQQQIIVSVYNSFVQYFILPLANKHSMNKKADNDSMLSISFFPYLYIDEAHHIIIPSDKAQKENIQFLINQFNESYNDESTNGDNTEEEDNKLSFVDIIDSLPHYRKAFSNLIYVYGLTCCAHMYLFSATIKPYDFSKFTMFDAIEENYLCRLNVALITNNSFVSSREIELNERIQRLGKHISQSSYKSIIIYTTLVKTARKIAKYFNSVIEMRNSNLKPIPSAVITAKDGAIYRDAQFKAFRSRRIRCLITVNCISEGVDLPEADTAIFFDDRKSIINIIQCVGRIMRKHHSKTSATFVIPLYKHDDMDMLYKNILCVLNGELGYGTADLRRILTIKYDDITNSNINLNVINTIGGMIIKYNQDYFNEISLNQKLERMSKIHVLFHSSIPGYDLEWKHITEKFEDFPDIKTFFIENINNDNVAGNKLRAMFGLVKIGYNKFVKVKGLNIHTTETERDRIIHLVQIHQFPLEDIINDNVSIRAK